MRASIRQGTLSIILDFKDKTRVFWEKGFQRGQIPHFDRFKERIGPFKLVGLFANFKGIIYKLLGYAIDIEKSRPPNKTIPQYLESLFNCIFFSKAFFLFNLVFYLVVHATRHWKFGCQVFSYFVVFEAYVAVLGQETAVFIIDCAVEHHESFVQSVALVVVHFFVKSGVYLFYIFDII
jgi:hypothetical protein